MNNPFLTVLITIYVIISQIYATIFFIDICKEWDSLLAIIFAGPIVAEFKALFWILFIW